MKIPGAKIMEIVRQLQNQEGISLIEVVVALGMVVVLATGLVISTTYSYRGGTASRNAANATRLSQEGVDVLRNIRDRDWSEFLALDTNPTGDQTYCLGNDLTLSDPGETNCSDNIDVGLRRYIILDWNESADPDRMEVRSVVEWAERSGTTRTSENATFFTDWRY